MQVITGFLHKAEKSQRYLIMVKSKAATKELIKFMKQFQTKKRAFCVII